MIDGHIEEVLETEAEVRMTIAHILAGKVQNFKFALKSGATLSYGALVP
jgi:hypothetical protein